MKANYNKRLTIETEDDLLLEAFQWGDIDAPSGVMLCLHGLSSHALWFQKLGELLRDQGFCLVAVNRRGSGGSGGRRMYAESLEILFDDMDLWMNTYFSERSVTCVGHCWGALLGRKWVEVRKPNLQGCVLIAPPYQTVFDKPWHERWLPILARIFGCLQIRLPYGAEIFSENPEVVSYIDRDPLFQRKCSLSLLAIGNELKWGLGRDADFLFIHPAKDKLLVLCEDGCANQLILGDVGHGVILELPEQLVGALS